MKPIVLVGPTASGKTDLALHIAHQINAQIISADSRQIYQHLSVGTAKPQGHWEQGKYLVEGVPYHLVDFLAPDKTFDAASFCMQAEQLQQNTRQPLIFAGGTGMYLHSFFIGLDALPASQPQLRAELTAFAAEQGKEALHKRLAQIDPLSAQQIPPGNIQRVMRALEISLLAKKPASSLRTTSFLGEFPAEKGLLVYLNWDKELLNQRILERTQKMLEPMTAEAESLLQQGFAPDCPALKSLGYQQAIDWLQGRLSKEETLEKIVTLTRQYAKRQRTWFNRYKNALRIDLNHPQDFELSKLTASMLDAWQTEK